WISRAAPTSPRWQSRSNPRNRENEQSLAGFIIHGVIADPSGADSDRGSDHPRKADQAGYRADRADRCAPRGRTEKSRSRSATSTPAPKTEKYYRAEAIVQPRDRE